MKKGTLKNLQSQVSVPGPSGPSCLFIQNRNFGNKNTSFLLTIKYLLNFSLAAVSLLAFQVLPFRNLSSGLASGARVKSGAGSSSKLAPVAAKPGPLKAFTSPEASKTGNTSHESKIGRESPPSRPSSGSSRSGHREMGVKLNSLRSEPRQKLSGPNDSVSHNHQILPQSGDRTRSTVTRTHGDFSSHKSHSSDKPSLEAVVTVTKGRPGEPAGVCVIPSPPASAKPPTPQRPSSAQRFRRMVLSSRDAQ